MKKEEILKEVHEDPLFKKIAEKLSDEERAKVEASINAFISDLISPMLDGLEQIANDPQAKEELKRQLGIDQNEVVKK